MLGHSATLSGATTTLAKLTNIDWSGVTIGEVNTTEYDATGGYETSEPGIKDPGEISGVLNFDKAQITSLETAINLGAAEVYTLTLADGSTLVCSGWIKAMSWDLPLREGVTVPITIRLSGQPTYTPAT